TLPSGGCHQLPLPLAGPVVVVVAGGRVVVVVAGGRVVVVVAGGRVVVVVGGGRVVVVVGGRLVAAEAEPASAGLRERQASAKPTNIEAVILTAVVLSTRMDSPLCHPAPQISG
ncbi:MAG TPA: hypothetical protein VGI44_04265, partial [Acidimicrobiales bacterium]